MIDPKLFRTDLDAVVANLAKRGVEFDKAAFSRIRRK